MLCKQMRLTYDTLALLRDRLINNIKMEPRLSIEFPLRSPDLTSLYFYLWGILKNVVYFRKSTTLTALREEIETACAAIAEDTFANVAPTVVQRTQKCDDAHGGHFE